MATLFPGTSASTTKKYAYTDATEYSYDGSVRTLVKTFNFTGSINQVAVGIYFQTDIYQSSTYNTYVYVDIDDVEVISLTSSTTGYVNDVTTRSSQTVRLESTTTHTAKIYIRTNIGSGVTAKIRNTDIEIFTVET